MVIRVTRGHQVSDCLCSFTSSLSLSPHPFLLSKTPHFSITCYFPITLSSLFQLLTSAKLCYSVSKILVPATPTASVNTTIYLCISRDLAGLRFGNVLFSTCAVFSLLRSNTPLYLRRLLQLNSDHHSSFNSLVTRYQDYLSFLIYRSTKFCVAFFYTPVKYSNSLLDSI